MRGVRVVGSFVLFAALAVAYTWPLAAHLDGFVVSVAPSWLGRADLMLTSWILSWDCHQLLRDPLRLFQANAFYPLPNALAFSEHLLAGALLVLPVVLVGHDPVLDHDVLVLASFALGGTGMALLLADLGVAIAAAITGGALFAFGPLRLAQLGHVHALSTHWAPFLFLFLQRTLRTGSRRAAAALAASAVLCGLSSMYCLVYFGLAAALFSVLHAAWRCPAAPRGRRRALLAGTIALAAIAPTLLPYATCRSVSERAAIPRRRSSSRRSRDSTFRRCRRRAHRSPPTAGFWHRSSGPGSPRSGCGAARGRATVAGVSPPCT